MFVGGVQRKPLIQHRQVLRTEFLRKLSDCAVRPALALQNFLTSASVKAGLKPISGLGPDLRLIFWKLRIYSYAPR